MIRFGIVGFGLHAVRRLMPGFKLSDEALRDVVATFWNAPAVIPGQPGISLHIDNGPDSLMNPLTGETWGGYSRGTSIDYTHQLGAWNSETKAYNWSAFNAIKQAKFVQL